MKRLRWDGGKYLIDGFPRNQENAQKWQDMVGATSSLSFVFLIECSEKVMQERLLNRGKTSGRSDDNSETIAKRFVTFQNETLPVIQHFEREGMVRRVCSDPGIDNVWHEVEAIFR